MGQFLFSLKFHVQSQPRGCRGDGCRRRSGVVPPGTKFLANREGNDLLQEMDPDLFLRCREGIAAVIQNRTPKLVEILWPDAVIRVFIDPV